MKNKCHIFLVLLLVLNLIHAQSRYKSIGTDFFITVLGKLNKRSIDQKINNELNQYQKEISNQLTENTGVLLRINLYEDQGGNLYTDTNSVVPVHVGLNEIDALSEYFNSSRIEAVSNYKNYFYDKGYFVWLKKENGKIIGGEIVNELKQTLFIEANKLAREKVKQNEFKKQGIWTGSKNLVLENPMTKSKYWAERYELYKKKIEQANKAELIQKLNSEFKILENQINKLSQKVEEIESRISANNTIISLLDLSIKIGVKINTSNVQSVNPSLVKHQTNIYQQQLNTIIIIRDKQIENAKKQDKKIEYELNPFMN